MEFKQKGKLLKKHRNNEDKMLRIKCLWKEVKHLITVYFTSGFNNKEILSVLVSKHHVYTCWLVSMEVILMHPKPANIEKQSEKLCRLKVPQNLRVKEQVLLIKTLD
ncbi:hypothetical protein XENORESO_004072 [Xenotaenia resolanae]|uniref:Uncharacterized protein n=1 Tax=Xenotaenia resolanae TaxID=208358 RepID=A0ABV0WCN6_9TELE